MSIRNDKLPFDPVNVTLDASNLIEASAGTGKTYSIAILTLRLVLEKQLPIRQILMVTFTKAAVAELETRIRQFMRKALKVSRGIAVNDETITGIVNASMNNVDVGPATTERLLNEAVLFLDETSILTIHGFCQRILTEFAFETSQVFGSEILTDLNTIITDKVNAFWRKYITTIHTGLLRELVNAGISRNRLVKLMENALSGKAISPNETLPGEFLSEQHQFGLYTYITGLEQQKEVIHLKIIDYILSNTPAIRNATEKNAYTQKNMLHLVDDPEALYAAIIANKEKANVKKVYPEILLDIDKVVAIEQERINTLTGLINQVHQLAIELITTEVNRYKQQNSQLGFDDMITKLHTAVVTENNEKLIHSLREKYTAAFIDEFQDTDKMQYEIFNRLFGEGAILFYIGDPKQSIYAWRKADLFTYFKAGDEVVNRFEMDVNYRSSARFIEGMNQFFLPMPGFDTFHFANEPNIINYTRVKSPFGSAKGELYKGGLPDMPITIFENPNNETINNAVAGQIVQLLGGEDFEIEEKGKMRKVRPADIGILVRRNDQAAELKLLLSKLGVPAVTIDDTKLLQSNEARSMLYLLAAVIDTNASSINKALLSPLTGYTAADILGMDDELALNRFRNYQHLWEHEGVYVMLTKFIADYKVKEELLKDTTENGERIITNTLQLMEILHKTQTQKQFAMLELAGWLRRGIEGMEVEGDEFEQRVESDEDAVKIITIHKSKGLEYNIVFAPFLDLAAEAKPGFVAFRDAETGNYLFSDKLLMSSEQLMITERQLEQENRRLIYVAVTRAVYKCYINKNTGGRYTQSAIAPFVNALKQNRLPLISFEAPTEVPANYKFSTTLKDIKPAYLQANNFQLTEVNWRKLSYTYLDAGHTSLIKSNNAKGQNVYDEFIFKILKRGANTGNLLHYIFERIDFADAIYWQQVIDAALKRFFSNPPAEYATHLLELLHHVTTTKMNFIDASFSLNELAKEKRLNELEFDFNVAPFNPEKVNGLSTPEVPIQLRYSKELEGIMNGKIDMFFEHAGKYFILDWKSNFLGDRPSDYSKESIRAAMTESNYHLQYLIYTLAVKKYLQLRVAGFDFDKHFGGVIYLFLRGIRKGSDQGVFAFKPAETLIDQLDKLLTKEVANSH